MLYNYLTTEISEILNILMNTYPTLKTEAELLKLITKDDEIETLKYKIEKHDYEYILKSLKIDNDYYKKKYNSINKKKV